MTRNPQWSEASRRILLVTADTAFRRWSMSALQEAGYCTHYEGASDAAWESLRRNAYKLLIVEHTLPGGSGLRLVLRMDHANLTLPVLLVTEAALPVNLQTHRCLRSVTILARPFGADRLLECVLATLRSAQSIKPVQPRLPLIGARSDPLGHRSFSAASPAVILIDAV